MVRSGLTCLSSRRHARLALLLWCLAWPGIVLALLMPLRSGMIVHADILMHFLLFGAMAFGAVGFSRNTAQFVVFTILTIVTSLSLECAQALMPHRSADVLDGLANTLGAATGAVVALATWQTWMWPASKALRPVRPLSQ